MDALKLPCGREVLLAHDFYRNDHALLGFHHYDNSS